MHLNSVQYYCLIKIKGNMIDQGKSKESEITHLKFQLLVGRHVESLNELRK